MLDRTELVVKNGASLLDRVYGPNWHEEIVLRRFNVADPCQCVIGQLYNNEGGKFSIALDNLGIFGEEHHYGFEAYGLITYEELQEAWETLIKERTENG